MGVCNQFDVLWDNLTGREHLLLFGAIKGLTKMQAATEADALLEQVSSVHDVHKAAGPGVGDFQHSFIPILMFWLVCPMTVLDLLVQSGNRRSKGT